MHVAIDLALVDDAIVWQPVTHYLDSSSVLDVIGLSPAQLQTVLTHGDCDAMADDKVHLELSREEAIVFFEWLARFNRANDVRFEDRAEQRVLWDIEAMLESKLVEPFESDFSELLARARAAVRDSDE
jgi:hypothetical protein